MVGPDGEAEAELPPGYYCRTPPIKGKHFRHLKCLDALLLDLDFSTSHSVINTISPTPTFLIPPPILSSPSILSYLNPSWNLST